MRDLLKFEIMQINYKQFIISISDNDDELECEFEWVVKRLDGSIFEEGASDSTEEAETEAKEAIDEFYED